MGCDIHFFVEKRRQPGGRWELVDKLVDKAEEYNSDEPHWGVENYKDQFYYDRNYYLFGILAQVRRDVEPNLGPPRGRPEDESDGYALIADQEGCDGHSHSYFTLAELLQFPWMTGIELTRLVKFEDYATWVRSGGKERGDKPGGADFWFSNDQIEPQEMDELVANYNAVVHGTEFEKKVAAAQREAHKDKAAEATYKAAMIDNCSNFDRTLLRLLDLARDVGQENVRIVFHFDN